MPLEIGRIRDISPEIPMPRVFSPYATHNHSKSRCCAINEGQSLSGRYAGSGWYASSGSGWLACSVSVNVSGMACIGGLGHTSWVSKGELIIPRMIPPESLRGGAYD
jgi:hypothetical protein